MFNDPWFPQNPARYFGGAKNARKQYVQAKTSIRDPQKRNSRSETLSLVRSFRKFTHVTRFVKLTWRYETFYGPLAHPKPKVWFQLMIDGVGCASFFDAREAMSYKLALETYSASVVDVVEIDARR